MVLSAHEAKLLICLMGTYWFVDDEYTFDLTHTERLVVLVKGDHIRRGHCFSKKKVLEKAMAWMTYAVARPNQIRLRELNGRGYFYIILVSLERKVLYTDIGK